MLKLQIQNVGEATVVVKDLEGYTDFVMEVAKGETKTKDVSNDLIQRLSAKLKALETLQWNTDGDVVLVGIRWSVLASDSADDRGMVEGLAGLPSMNEFQAANYSTGGGATDAVATGTGLLGNQVKASLQMATVDGSARVDFEAVNPGAPGNGVSVEFATPAGVLAVAVVANKITVTPAAGGSTAAAIAAAVNGDANAKLLVQASEGVAGTVNEAIAEKYLDGGIGPGVSLTLNGTACVLTEVLDGQLTFDIPAGISAAGYIIPLEFRNGPHITRLSVPVAA
jgi:hypothetical protein